MKKLSINLGLCACFAAAAALATGCGSSSPTTGTDAGTGSDAGSGDAGSPPMTYCDGFGVSDGTNTVLVETYNFSGGLKTEGCSTTLNGETDGTALTTVIGIYDLDTLDNGSATPPAALFPSNCGDLGLSGFTDQTASMSMAPPSGASTVAGTYGKTPTGAVYGVVTAVYPWAAGKSGTLYIEDATTAGEAPVKNSGIQIYVSKKATITGSVPALGDVVAITGLTWSPYNGSNQFEAAGATTITKLGTSPLPTPVMLSAAAVGPMSSPAMTGYEGMRVQVTGSLSVKGTGTSGTCPAGIQKTPTTGG